MDDFQDSVSNISLTSLLSGGASVAMMFGGVVPYIPQYRDIKLTENADGFSLYVCLALLIANTLRIFFWFGHPFEMPLLIQSVIMNFAMLALIELCIRVRNKTLIVPAKARTFTEDKSETDGDDVHEVLPCSRVFLDFDAKFFWNWTDFLSYVEFLATFSAIVGLAMYFCSTISMLVELVGFLAVFTEAMLGAPQFYKNFSKKSTLGMSKKMVCMWTLGDVYKTLYFVLRDTPIQFWVCGMLQIAIDLAILLQVFLYRRSSGINWVAKPLQHSS